MKKAYKKEEEQFFNFYLDTQEYEKMYENEEGACVKCGSFHEDVDPECRYGRCPVCKRFLVFSVYELNNLGRIGMLVRE